MEHRELSPERNEGESQVVLNQGQEEEQEEHVPPPPPVPRTWVGKRILIKDTPEDLKDWNEKRRNPKVLSNVRSLTYGCGNCDLQFRDRHLLVQHRRQGHPHVAHGHGRPSEEEPPDAVQVPNDAQEIPANSAVPRDEEIEVDTGQRIEEMEEVSGQQKEVTDVETQQWKEEAEVAPGQQNEVAEVVTGQQRNEEADVETPTKDKKKRRKRQWKRNDSPYNLRSQTN